MTFPLPPRFRADPSALSPFSAHPLQIHERGRLLGHGAGADFALRYAARRPEIVSRVALCHPRRWWPPESTADGAAGVTGPHRKWREREHLAAFVSLSMRVWTGAARPGARTDRPDDVSGPVRGPRGRLSTEGWVASMHDAARRLGVRADLAWHAVPEADGRLATSASSGVLAHAAAFLLS